MPLSPGTVCSLHMVEAHLNAVVQNSRSSESLLPEKENIAPNQHMWAETARKMGVQRQKRLCPASTSFPEPPTTQHIGGLNCKQPWKLTDPYASGMNSGRDAAPDMQSVAQNTEACVHTAAAANSVVPPLSQPSKRSRKHTGTPAPSHFPPAALLPLYLPALAPPAWYPPCPAPGVQLATPLAHFAWYLVSAPAPSPPGVYAQNLYTSYWPSYFHPPQSHP